MRTAQDEAELAAHIIDPHPPREPRVMCPPTPPPEAVEVNGCDTALMRCQDGGVIMGDPAAVSSIANDRRLYMKLGEDDEEEQSFQDCSTELSPGNEKNTWAKGDGIEIETSFGADVALPDQATIDATNLATPESVAMDGDAAELFRSQGLSAPVTAQPRCDCEKADQTHQSGPLAALETSGEQSSDEIEGDSSAPDQHPSTMNSVTDTSHAFSDLPPTPRFDFSDQRLYPHYPSSFLRPGSKFIGTQQSDRQIYNVDVQILTLSVAESSLTGYLRICGLTEDHPTLTTFFTGEIIGGPNHKYTFQTKDPAGAQPTVPTYSTGPASRPGDRSAKTQSATSTSNTHHLP